MKNLDENFYLTYKEEINISLFITNNCNLSCSYCIVWDILEWIKKINYIDEEFIVNFMNFISKIQSRNINLKIVWWEPLLNKDMLFLLLKELIKQWILNSIYITTNSIFVDKIFLLKIRNINLNNVIKFKISFDWPFSISRWGVLINNKILDKISLIIKILWSKSLIISSVVSVDNFSFFYKNIKYILLHIKPGELMYALEKGALWDTKTVKVLKKEYLKLLLFYKNFKKDTKIDFGEIEDLEFRPCSKWLDHFITYEWMIYPCYSYIRKWFLNNKFELSIDKIDTEDKYIKLLKWWLDIYKQKYNSWKSKRRIDFSHCYYTKLDSNDLENTFNNLSNFSIFKKYCYDKLYKWRGSNWNLYI